MKSQIAPFETLFPPNQQQQWLTVVHFQDLVGKLSQSETFPDAQKEPYDTLGKKPKSKKLIAVLESYIKNCIPAPYKTAGKYWSCVVLPEVHEKKNPVYTRLYAGEVEVLTAYFDPMRNTLNFSFHAARSPLQERTFLQRLKHRFRFTSMRLTSHQYQAGGVDQLHFALSNVGETRRLLEETTFLKAIRAFNLRMMQQNPASHRELHNDWLIQQILSG